MGTYKHLFQTVQSTNLKYVESQLRHYTKIGYHIQGGIIHSHSKLKSLLPFRLETEYTIFMQKTISQIEELMEDTGDEEE